MQEQGPVPTPDLRMGEPTIEQAPRALRALPDAPRYHAVSAEADPDSHQERAMAATAQFGNLHVEPEPEEAAEASQTQPAAARRSLILVGPEQDITAEAGADRPENPNQPIGESPAASDVDSTVLQGAPAYVIDAEGKPNVPFLGGVYQTDEEAERGVSGHMKREQTETDGGGKPPSTRADSTGSPRHYEDVTVEVQPDPRHDPSALLEQKRFERPSWMAQRHPITGEPVIRTGQRQDRRRQNEFRLHPEEQIGDRKSPRNPGQIQRHPLTGKPIVPTGSVYQFNTPPEQAYRVIPGEIMSDSEGKKIAEADAELVDEAIIDSIEPPYSDIPVEQRTTEQQMALIRWIMRQSVRAHPSTESQVDQSEQQAGLDWVDEQTELIGNIYLRTKPSKSGR